MPKPAGQPKLPRITGTPDHFTGMLDHIKWNDGPHGMERWTTSNGIQTRAAKRDKKRNDAT